MMNLRLNLKHIAFAITLLTAAGPSASAQLVFGSTTTSTSNPSAFYLDVGTGQTTVLWNSASNKKVNGLAADQVRGRLYANDAARLNFWDYGSIGIVPTFIAGMYRSNGTTTSATGFDGLAWANGALYGATSFASSTFTRGIYRIPLIPNGSNQLITTQVWSDPDPTGTLVLGGIDFNPDNNLFYATQLTDSTGGGGFLTPGIYTIDVFGNGAFTRIANLPDGATRADGLAVGGGKLWITQQQPAQNQISIYPFDLATMTYGTTINVPLTDGTNRATGATWAPGALTPVQHPAMQILSVVSRKTHGSAGDFDIALPLTGEPGVECRQTNGNQTIVVTFSNQPLSGNASVTSGTASLAGNPVFIGNSMTINLTGVADIQKVTLAMSNVTDEFSQVMPDASLSVNILAGDTNGNKVVNTTDIAQTKSGSGIPVTAANFKSDLNANGTINTTDIAQVKANAGHTVP
jgi:hypothetical protein